MTITDWWMKLISNSSAGLGEISGESNSWTPENMYREVDGIIAAAPSLESLEITTTGTAGSMRRAKVKFKVYNTQQLRQAQQAFFIPGMSAVILWGWNMQSSGKSVSSSAHRLDCRRKVMGVYHHCSVVVK